MTGQQEIKSLSGAKLRNPDELADVIGAGTGQARAQRKVRFGVFEVDFELREIRKRGLRLRIQQKPFQILKRLLETPGEFVSRAELARCLWPDLHVLFDRSLNTAVNVLRSILGDPSRSPRFIETRPGLGYRFIAPVEEVAPATPVRGPGIAARNSNAYESYLKGRYFCNKMTEDDLRKSLAHFEGAIVEDPDFTLAYAGLADVYSMFAFLGMLPAAQAMERSREFTAAALRRDAQLAEAHVSLAGVKKFCDWDWEGAEASYRTALELNPNDPRAHHLYAAHLSGLGRFEEAGSEMRRALALDPLSLVINMEAAWNLYMARDFQGAFEQSWAALAMEPRFAAAQHTLGLAYEQMGMHEEAIVELQNARVCSGGHPVTIAALGHAYATVGNQCEAEAALRELEELSGTRLVSPCWLSILYAGLGRDACVLDSLENGLRQHDVWMVWLKVEPRFDLLRPHARFQKLLRGVGLSPH